MANILNSLSRVKQGDIVLSVRDIKKTFIEGGQPLHILRGGGFDLHRGEIIALVGQSGCGKSTLLQCVGLLDKPSGGSIVIGGAPVHKMDEDMRTKIRRNKIGFVYQKHNLLSDFTALENVELDEENIESLGRGNLIDALYKKVSRPKLIKPTYLIKHPIDLSPLARANDDNKQITDRFQLVVNGQEIINGYSELVDAKEQEARLIEQSKLKAGGDEEAMSIDEEYIKAMEYGMPPISGWGLGVDRFMQFLTNVDNIRDVVLYPLMRPRDMQ